MHVILGPTLLLIWNSNVPTGFVELPIPEIHRSDFLFLIYLKGKRKKNGWLGGGTSTPALAKDKTREPKIL